MDLLHINLVSSEDRSNPTQITIHRHISLKAFHVLAEKTLKIEIFSLFIKHKRLSDMSQVSDGDTVTAIHTTSPVVSKQSLYRMSRYMHSQSLESAHGQLGVKVAVLGPKGAGKTSLILRFVHGFFKANGLATVMEAEYEKTIQVRSKDISLGVFDTAGEVNYDCHALSRIPQLDACLLVIAADQLENWSVAAKYHKMMKSRQPGALTILVVTKIDLIDAKVNGDNKHSKTKLAHIASYARDNHLILLKTSAKSNVNVHKVFSTVADRFANPEKFSADQTLNSEAGENYPFLFRAMDKVLGCSPRCLKRNE